MDNNYILVAGYGWSGSSAVVDLLKEYDAVVEPNVEFRLIKDPYGLADLRYQITKNWDALSVDTAVKDFLWYATCLNRSSAKSRFSLSTGLDYNKKIGSVFMQETYKFIKEITSYTYQSDWWMSDFKRTKSQILRRKILRKLHLDNKKPIMYFSHCTEQEFDSFAKNYLNALFSEYEGKRVLLDQAVPPQSPEMALNFFDNAKMVIVDRDPRDIYVDLINGKNLIGLELSKSHDVKKYILWHRAYRQRLETIKSLPFVKCLQFEKLVCNYDETLSELEAFFHLPEKNHTAKGEFFNPKKSAKNVRIWKNYPYQGELKTIEEELPEYIFKE